MSLDATVWAWRVELPQIKGGSKKPMKRLVLLSLADRAGEDHCCYPSVSRLSKDTGMDRKTIFKVIAELIEDGLIEDSGKREGSTKQVIVYRLKGVTGREEAGEIKNKQYQKRDSSKDENNSTKNGTVPKTEQYHFSGQRVPFFRGNSTKNGTQNLSRNLSLESKNKKSWLCLKKLREEILLATDQQTYEQIKNATWFDRELRAFELYNAAKNLCDELMHYHFADWLINACGKYQTREHATFQNSGSQVRCSPSAPHQLSDKQVHSFAQKLSQHPEFASQFAAAGESYDQLAARIAVKLSDPAQAKQWEPYLKQVGFKGTLQGAA
ncbi:helix-turn-helix domain-containing protein [Acinetobacter baumannii]|uniref:helix-turn-helix domain-containing protein n=1 Tax=Acinetobacter baumannii TaxID=470 RepID=UPI00081031D4|nr:helix-turn-helix domain-containing protein [Acinetobacter baumannii]MDC4638802.1 helix-turn-helix domain-containing protein [Acinetobacter baumannii]MDC5668602.1 helix-turn-helix domain-containing protein [Acinetobacter baumannii]MDC5679201.1 helix-turn-helix domain-containing protein [Acinetobacter baumannii]MDK2201679.1 helix-turn-helix domain-containing protein [Acinetobacter baumannii]